MNAASAERLQAAWTLCTRGEYAPAGRILESLLDQSPQDAGAWLLLARLSLQLGEHDKALRAAQQASMLSPAHSETLYVLGRVHKARGEAAAAEAAYRRALGADPANADACTSLALLLRADGRLDEAIALYRRTLAIRPEHAEARSNLGHALAAREQQLRRLATELAGAGRRSEALEVIRQALQLVPGAADLWLGAGTLALEMGLMAESLGFLEEAARLDPGSYAAVSLARRACVAGGLYERALQYAQRAYQLSPSPDNRFTRKLVLPAICDSVEAIQAARRQYAAGLEEILASNWQPQDPYNALQLPTFFLAYHGESERELQVKAARMCSQVLPSLAATAPHCSLATRRPGRIRVGFISRYLVAHSIGKTTRGLIEQLDRARFEVYALHISPSHEDRTTELIRSSADHYVKLDLLVERARESIAALELDVLFYQDIGMEPTSWFLAFARLAPVQCVSFGHPCTTGIPNMDYFVSNDLFELPGAAAHYSERLFLLHDLPTLAYYYRPAVPRDAPQREKFGFAPEHTLYLCPQTLFKLHPEFDRFIGGILERDPAGRVVLIAGEFAEWTRALQERFARHIPEVLERIVFIPRLEQDGFLELLASGDVVLDPLHFNGMNSSLESFAVGTPVVTLPTRLQRGRHTQAMYRKMEIFDCIARDREEYVAIAVRLGTDRAYRAQLRERILARNHLLFEDRRVVTEFERFFVEAVAGARRAPTGTQAPTGRP